MQQCVSAMGGGRIYWIDALKGLTIIGVIWVHAGGHPEWLTPATVNSLFFFMAGMFFKDRPFVEFVKKHAVSLLIPFLLFYIISYPFCVVRELWDYRSLDMVTWNMIFDIFKIDMGCAYLYSNVPLWFLLCLFWVQLFYWFIFKLPLWGRLLILAGIWIGWERISSIPTPLMINNALCELFFFGLGQVTSGLIFKLGKNKRAAVCCLILGLSLMLITHYSGEKCQTVNMFYLAWCLTMVMAASLFGSCRRTHWLEFFGLNSLVILGTHIWFLTPIMRFLFKINGAHSVTTSLLGTCVCALLLVPVIVYVNRFFPILAGKKHQPLPRSNTRTALSSR